MNFYEAIGIGMNETSQNSEDKIIGKKVEGYLSVLKIYNKLKDEFKKNLQEFEKMIMDLRDKEIESIFSKDNIILLKNKSLDLRNLLNKIISHSTTSKFKREAGFLYLDQINYELTDRYHFETSIKLIENWLSHFVKVTSDLVFAEERISKQFEYLSGKEKKQSTRKISLERLTIITTIFTTGIFLAISPQTFIIGIIFTVISFFLLFIIEFFHKE